MNIISLLEIYTNVRHRNFWELSLRSYSTSYTGGELNSIEGSSQLNKPLANKPETLALNHIEKPTTHTIINKILSNQNLFLSEDKLNKLLQVEGVEFDLPVNKNNDLFIELTGSSAYKGHMGVYMFTDMETNQKYVGSSNLLRKRLDYYFKGDFTPTGKFLPLLHEKGLDSFKLTIFKF